MLTYTFNRNSYFKTYKILTPKQGVNCICSNEIELGFVQSRQLSKHMHFMDSKLTDDNAVSSLFTISLNCYHRIKPRWSVIADGPPSHYPPPILTHSMRHLALDTFSTEHAQTSFCRNGTWVRTRFRCKSNMQNAGMRVWQWLKCGIQVWGWKRREVGKYSY